LYFLGYFRFEVPARSEYSAATAANSNNNKSDSNNDASSTTTTSSSCPHLWLYECHHNHHKYLCFPPYCAPGGLRSRLFPPAVDTTTTTLREIEIVADSDGSQVEVEEEDEDENLFALQLADPFFIPFPTSQTKSSRRKNKGRSKTSSSSLPPKEGSPNDLSNTHRLYCTKNSTNNPLDLILQSPYLPLPTFVKQSLEGRQYDWNTLGGSKCSCKRHLLAVEKELELACSLTDSGSFSEGDTGTTTSGGDHNTTFPSKYNPKSEGEKGPPSSSSSPSPSSKVWGLGIAAQRFVSQAVTSYYSLTSEIKKTEPQDSTTATNFDVQDKQDKKAEIQQEHLQKPRLINQLPSPSHETMTAQQNVASAKVHVTNDNPAGKPLPQAVLVYHESAHSIVFRDHLRRQQSAIRRTSYQMENSSQHATTSPSSPSTPTLQKQNTTMTTDSSSSTPAPSRVPSTVMESVFEDGVVIPSSSEGLETDVGYESGGSRGSAHSNRSTYSARSGGENSSVASGGSGGKKRRSNPVRRKRAPDAMQPVVIANFQPVVEPLSALDLNSSNVFEPLLDADPTKEEVASEMSSAEIEVVELLKKERAVVKTIRNADWTAFFQKFKPSEEGKSGTHDHHPGQTKKKSKEKTKNIREYRYNSFVSSTSILPSCAKKMRCFGSTNEYAIGVVFALPQAFPDDDGSEDEAAKRTRTWSWPSGYSAKTEFNIDHRGNLINGREEALVPLSGLRKMNHSYLYDKDYIVGGRMVKGGLTTIPYNECYIRVGALGRISRGVDVATGEKCDDADGSGRSFDHGIGLPIALFVREADYGHLVRLLRTRARFAALLGSNAAEGIPLLFITPEHGVRVLTENLQCQVLKKMSWELNPFQNPELAYRTSIDDTSEPHLQQKLEELLDLDNDKMKQVLTPEEMARIAGGFGATDESIANLLNEAMQRDIMDEKNGPGHKLQDLVNEGLAFALRANDYHTSRQMLILYTLVASKRHDTTESKPLLEHSPSSSSNNWRDAEKNMENEGGKEKKMFRDERTLGFIAKPPPPPLDTDRLRSATNSDGLLAVLGAAQVLRAMQDGSAKRRVKESIDSIEEWIESGEQSVAFRVASWRDQRAAQGDLKIAMENDSNFMAFVSNKAISNRKKFAKQLRDAAAVTDFDSLMVLKSIHSVAAQMRSPCLRLELLQYILGLDNRYSVAHVTRSVELAATCLNLSENDDNNLLK